MLNFLETTLNLGSLAMIFIKKSLVVIIIFAVFYLVSIAVERLILLFFNRRRPEQHYISTIFSSFVKILFMLVGLVTALGTVGIDVSAIVASLGLTGFAISFAFKDFLSNVLAGFIVILNRTYRIGDDIEVIGVRGVVRGINLRYTILSHLDGESLIPNATLLNNRVMIHRATKSDAIE